MNWILIDNLVPNKPVLINLANVSYIDWDSGTLTIGYTNELVTEYECEKSVFIQLAGKLNIIEEIE